MRERKIRTDAELAAAADVSGAGITRLWKNTAGPKTISKVAAALGLRDPLRPVSEKALSQLMEDAATLLDRYPERFNALARDLRNWVLADDAQRATLASLSRILEDKSLPPPPSAITVPPPIAPVVKRRG